jgi:hypothetical protein
LLQATGKYSLLKGYPYRAWPLVAILAVMLGFKELHAFEFYRGISERASLLFMGRRGLALGIIGCAVLSTSAALHLDRAVRSAIGVSTNSLPQTHEDLDHLYAWLRTQTPPESLILVPPEFWWGDFLWKSDRGMAFQVKTLPYDDAGMREWQTRYERLGTIFSPPFTSAKRDLIRSAVQDYLVDYLILRRDQISLAGDWPMRYENATYRVYGPFGETNSRTPNKTAGGRD